MFYAPELIFGGIECVRSRFHVLLTLTHFRWYRGHRVPFHVLRSRTHFRRYRRRRVPFSCFALPDSFSAVPRASGPVLMFCAPGLVFRGTKGVRFLFHVLRSQTHFRRYRRRRVSFSCFALPDSFSAVPRVSGPLFMFCAPGLIFGRTEGVGSRFHVLRSRNHFKRYRGRRVPFHVLRTQTRFRQYRGRPILFSCFTRPDSFSAVPRLSGPIFMFCAPGHVFGCTESDGSRFHVLRSQTRFRRYRGR
jgi:hypothetical protein